MATTAEYGFDVFAPKSSAQRRRLRGIRVRSPLGIYTTPLLLLVLWEVLSSTGVLSATTVASPSQVVSAATHLWSHGEPSTLRADIAISLPRGPIGLAM